MLTWVAPRVALMVRVTSGPMKMNVLKSDLHEAALVEVSIAGHTFQVFVDAADAVRLSGQFRDIWWASAAPAAFEAAAIESKPVPLGLREAPWTDLSPREMQILSALADEHLSVVQVARQFNLSVHTVRNHIKSIYRTVNVHHMGALVSCYLKASHAS